MKPLFYLFAILTIVYASCLGDQYRSSNILDEDKMADLLNDMALAEGFTESFLFRDTLQSKDTLVQRELDKVLQLHKISVEQFSKSFHYYKTHPEAFKILVDTANARSVRNREQSYGRRKVNPS